MKKTLVYTLVIMFCFGLLWFFFLSKGEDAQLVSKVSINQIVSPKVTSSTIEREPALSPTGSSSMAKLGQEYSTSRNARSFVEQAKLRPDLGGYTFAIQMLSTCDVIGINRYRELRYLPKESQADFTKRREVTQFWYQRCQGLLDNEANILATFAMNKDALKKKDVLALMSARIDKAIASKDRAEVRAALQQLLAMKPPIIMRNALYSIAMEEAAFYNYRVEHQTGLWFDGKAHLEADEQMYYFALDLLECSFGNICDQNDSYVTDACFAGAGCYSNRFAYIRNVTLVRMFAKHPEAAEKFYQSLLAMHQRLVTAVEHGNVDVFMRP